jgi:hypothetical protein
MGFNLEIEAPVNGRVHKANVTVVGDDGGVLFTDSANLTAMLERRKLAKRLAERLGDPAKQDDIEAKLEQGWSKAINRQREEQKHRQETTAKGSDQFDVELLDAPPERLARPLCLAAGHAYAVAWLHKQTTVRQWVDKKTGDIVVFDPPKVTVEMVLIVVRDDGHVFADVPSILPGAAPLSQLGLTVSLPIQPAPGRAWSGAGVKRYVNGERPEPADVFRRVARVIDRFMDFSRSLASQETMCEMIACYVLMTYLLDAFNVVGYLWPNGDKGAGKTNFLVVVAELAYLGQVILAGGSYASLRDLADCGAFLAFDDAEGIMDVKRTDPDKRTLLLAGNRRGAHVTVKELVNDQWTTRHIDAFCPRAFSAIRLPDDVLGSRTITVPLVRSADAHRAKVNPLDYTTWPCDRRRLVDDLWAVGLAHLADLREYDTRAAGRSSLTGRDLEPWRGILAVALWLEEAHGVEGLFGRMEKLSVDYQTERGDLEGRDPVRVAIRALQKMVSESEDADFTFAPKELAERMNQFVAEDDSSPDGKEFTNPRKVGWLLRKLRFKKGTRDKSRQWQTSMAEVNSLARAYGMRETRGDAYEGDGEEEL